MNLGRLFRADLLLVNGNVITIDPAQPRAQAIAVKGDRIIAVGSTAEIMALQGPGTRVYDLGGRTAVPGFNDCHCHTGSFGLGLANVNLQTDPVRTVDEIVRRIAQRARSQPTGTWIIARGYDNNNLPGQVHPSRWDLDRAAPDHYVQCVHNSGHMSVLNSKALALCGVGRDTPDPEGGHIVKREDGEPTGLLQEHAQYVVRPHIPPASHAEFLDGIEAASDRYLSEGITSASDAAVGRITPLEVGAWQAARRLGKLKIRMNLMVHYDYMQPIEGPRGERFHGLQQGIHTGFGDHWVRVGPAKMFADGSLIGRTAAMFEGFETDPDNRGFFVVEPEELRRRVLLLHESGWQIAIHAIGDRAVWHIIDCYEEALTRWPDPDRRHRIEHAGVLSPRALDRMAALGILGIPQQHFIGETGDGYIKNLGRERLRWTYPQRAYLERGMVLSGSSDRPVVNGAPLLGIHDAVNQKTASGQPYVPEEAVSAEEMIRAYTWGSAYTSHEEHMKGSLEAGKLADITVLDRDITAIPPQEIAGARVVATWVGGRLAWGEL